jgi:hypothetical protein
VIFEHQRFEIWNLSQHPYKHSLAEFSYTNPALPGVVNVEQALGWMLAVLYPNAKAAVANPAALPLLGNTLNDYRVVLDDGDGLAASYRWEQREGDVAPKWYKVMDMDWSTDSILASYLDITEELYVVRRGRQDIDDTGAIVTGLYAGQTIYGGTQANQNLTLRANSGDGVGSSTGYVQVDDNFRPATNNSRDIGTPTEKFKDLYVAGSSYLSTLTLSGGSITDSSGAISFGNENLTTTGDIGGKDITASASFKVGTLTISDGSITDSDGSISFGTTNLSTTGTITGAINSKLADITFANGSITSTTATISFGTNDLLTTGTLGAGAITGTSVAVDNLFLDGNTLSITNANGNLILVANGTGVIDAQSAMTTLGIQTTGTHTITGQLNADNIRIDGNVISSENLNGNITLQPNGTGWLETSKKFLPTADGTLDLGATGSRFKDVFFSGSIGDGTTLVSQATIQSLRDILVGASAGMTLFYDGSKWLASAPDTEIDHGTISGLADDDHTQYLLLAGRSGGQTAYGGTLASNNLNLDSTSHATKGVITFNSRLEPLSTAVYSGGWTGIDIGSSSKYFNDLFMRGEAKNFRLENFTFATLPAFSSQNIGRIMFATDTTKAYIDTGTAIKVLGVSKYVADTVWNGSDTTKDINVSADIQDARNAIWALHDNVNDFDRIYCSIKAISATTVRITVSPALPAASYRLIGLE